MMQLDHPNISNILEVYDFKDEFTLVCQICQGGDLMKFLIASKKKNHQNMVAIIIKQLLRAVIYLHNIGIVHRDIKPQNILFDFKNSHSIKLIDFGIATKIEPGQILTARIGTPAYLAPQIILEKYTQKVDVWAIGVTMYHLLSGSIPFRVDNIKSLMVSIVKKQISFQNPIWDCFSKECIELIDLMTTKDYNQRPSAKQMFQHPYFKRFSDTQQSEDQRSQFASNMRRFQFKNQLQASIQTYIASQLLSIGEKNELVNFFREFDKDNDGVISRQELRTALGKRKNISNQRLDTLMEIIDTNGSGKIDYTQFLTAGFVDARFFTVDRLKQAFAHFDTNANGRISFEQVMDFMEDMAQSEEQVQKIFKQFDINGDGSISDDEFIEMMMERSKYMNLDQLKMNQKQKQPQICSNKLSLDKLCLDFAIPRGQTALFFKNLTKSKRQNMQKQNLFTKIV